MDPSILLLGSVYGTPDLQRIPDNPYPDHVVLEPQGTSPQAPGRSILAAPLGPPTSTESSDVAGRDVGIGSSLSAAAQRPEVPPT
jgi:hypothetical protein